MGYTKKCQACGIDKDASEYSKRSASKDGLQQRCKQCNKKDNHKFRTEIDPEHHAIWQKNNLKRLNEIVLKYRRADKGGQIYYIKSPEGKYYIGMTEMYLKVRLSEHRARYRRCLKGDAEPLPGLHDSFTKWGVENHEAGTILYFEDIDRDELHMFEKAFIKTFTELGICLNINSTE